MELNLNGIRKPKKFKTGQLVVTDDIVNLMVDEAFRAFVYASYIRYCANDWGDLENCDKKLNRRNIKHGGNLGGRYVDNDHGWEIWILTTESRDRTIITFPDKMREENEVEVKKEK